MEADQEHNAKRSLRVMSGWGGRPATRGVGELSHGPWFLSFWIAAQWPISGTGAVQRTRAGSPAEALERPPCPMSVTGDSCLREARAICLHFAGGAPQSEILTKGTSRNRSIWPSRIGILQCRIDCSFDADVRIKADVPVLNSVVRWSCPPRGVFSAPLSDPPALSAALRLMSQNHPIPDVRRVPNCRKG